MRGVFGLLGLILTLALVGVLVKKQLNPVAGGPALAPLTAPTGPGGAPVPVNPAALQQQSQQIQQQYKQAIDQAMQATRPEPDAK